MQLPSLYQTLHNALHNPYYNQCIEEDQQTEGQLHPTGCQEAELPPVLAPLPSFTPRNTELWHYNLPPPHFLYFFSTMSSFVYLYSLYVHMVKLYLSVFERLLSVFNVNCMHQGSESNAI